jgi:hypothetical protein
MGLLVSSGGPNQDGVGSSLLLPFFSLFLPFEDFSVFLSAHAACMSRFFLQNAK